MATAAAVIVAKERRLVVAFTAAGATSPETARPLDMLGIDRKGIAFRRLQKRAVIRESAPDRFYLDVPSWQALRSMRRRILLVMIVVLVIALVLGVLGYRLA